MARSIDPRTVKGAYQAWLASGQIVPALEYSQLPAWKLDRLKLGVISIR